MRHRLRLLLRLRLPLPLQPRHSTPILGCQWIASSQRFVACAKCFCHFPIFLITHIECNNAKIKQRFPLAKFNGPAFAFRSGPKYSLVARAIHLAQVKQIKATKLFQPFFPPSDAAAAAASAWASKEISTSLPFQELIVYYLNFHSVLWMALSLSELEKFYNKLKWP